MIMTIHDALESLHPTAEWVVRGDTLEWLDENVTAPTQVQIDTEIARLQTEYDAKAYARTRADAYPSIGDQLDMLWHAIDADTTLKSNYADFHTALKAVKDANPKP